MPDGNGNSDGSRLVTAACRAGGALSIAIFTQLRFTMRAFREHARNEKLTRAELESLQLHKLRKLARYANKHSPYYARVIAQAGINLDTCTPRDFPVLTKKLLMQNFDQIVTDRSITRQRVADFLTRSTDPLDLLDNKYHVLHVNSS